MSLQLFSLEAGHELGKNVSASLGIPLSPHQVLDAAELFAKAIARIHDGGSLVELLEG
jgi:phosphoribosylpyrophosphate synthetase